MFRRFYIFKILGLTREDIKKYEDFYIITNKIYFQIPFYDYLLGDLKYSIEFIQIHENFAFINFKNVCMIIVKGGLIDSNYEINFYEV